VESGGAGPIAIICHILRDKMKLLIVCQKIDVDDHFLGFFHEWVIKMAEHFENVSVIALSVGRYELPPAIKVYSLGKEGGISRLKYLRNFFRHIVAMRKDYDAVFVHQNQEYPILGGILWKMMGKKVFMWRNHYAGTWLTNISAFFCDRVFCTSKDSYTARFKKTMFMPVGVDTEVFRADESDRNRGQSVLSLGRISPSKRIHLLIDALVNLQKRGQDFTASIYGKALPVDAEYLENLKRKVRENSLEDKISFMGPVANTQAPALYSSHKIFVNMSPAGMFDKTIFEAMSSGALPLVSNNDLRSVLDPALLFKDNDAEDLSLKLQNLLSMQDAEVRRLQTANRKYVEENHGLSALAAKLSVIISNLTKV
jgi:glycosyltransferase involved in cell wall biosynthesis